MVDLFYAALVAFAFNEFFFVFNRKRLDTNFKNKDVMSVKSIDILHYMLKVLSVFWPFIGLLSSMSSMFLVLISVWFLKFLLYHISVRTYSVWTLFSPFVNIGLYLAIFLLRR